MGGAIDKNVCVKPLRNRLSDDEANPFILTDNKQPQLYSQASHHIEDEMPATRRNLIPFRLQSHSSRKQRETLTKLNA